MHDDETDEEHRARMQALKAKQDGEVRERRTERGIVIVHDGDGKGKSTAAFGMAVRAAGHGQRVGIVQFIKGSWVTGEQRAFERFPEIDHVTSGEGFTWDTQDRTRDIAAARAGFERARDMVEQSRADGAGYSLVILDEIHLVVHFGYLPVEEVVALVRDKPDDLSIVLTGRNAPAELIAVANTVTRMESVKHAYDAGIRARKGVDF